MQSTKFIMCNCAFQFQSFGSRVGMYSYMPTYSYMRKGHNLFIFSESASAASNSHIFNDKALLDGRKYKQLFHFRQWNRIIIKQK